MCGQLCMVSEPKCRQGEHLQNKVAWPGCRSLRGGVESIIWTWYCSGCQGPGTWLPTCTEEGAVYGKKHLTL